MCLTDRMLRLMVRQECWMGMGASPRRRARQSWAESSSRERTQLRLRENSRPSSSQPLRLPGGHPQFPLRSRVQLAAFLAARHGNATYNKRNCPQQRSPCTPEAARPVIIRPRSGHCRPHAPSSSCSIRRFFWTAARPTSGPAESKLCGASLAPAPPTLLNHSF